MKRWSLRPPNESLSAKLADCLNVNPIVAQLLLNRGIQSLDAAKAFIQPRSSSDQFDQKNLDTAIACLQSAIRSKKSILVYGDYDVDGMTSTALFVDITRRLGGQVRYVVPHRFRDGYGLSPSGLDAVLRASPDLLVTLDCGVSSLSEIDQVKATKSQVLIFDHHQVGEKLPNADAILNPRLLAEHHPFSGLCTVGIVYQFFLAYNAQHNIEFDLDHYLDLVALGTIADVAPLWGENRYLVREGLRQISRSTRPGIRALINVSQTGKGLNERDIGFGLAPRLNAAGRLSDARAGVELLLCEAYREAEKMAQKLDRLNLERRHIGSQLLAQADHMMQRYPDNLPIIVLAHSDWHAGVIGIAASRLVEKYERPTVLIAIDASIARASARTCGTVNLYQVLSACKTEFLSFGGHKEAAGFSLSPANVESAITKISESASQSIQSEALIPEIEIDQTLLPHQLTLDLVDAIQELRPFGPKNPSPIFYTDALIPVDSRVVGSGAHLKLTLADTTHQTVVDAIGFNMANRIDALNRGRLEIAFRLERNEWGGQSRLQINIVDIK